MLTENKLFLWFLCCSANGLHALIRCLSCRRRTDNRQTPAQNYYYFAFTPHLRPSTNNQNEAETIRDKFLVKWCLQMHGMHIHTYY